MRVVGNHTDGDLLAYFLKATMKEFEIAPLNALTFVTNRVRQLTRNPESLNLTLFQPRRIAVLNCSAHGTQAVFHLRWLCCGREKANSADVMLTASISRFVDFGIAGDWLT